MPTASAGTAKFSIDVCHTAPCREGTRLSLGLQAGPVHGQSCRNMAFVKVLKNAAYFKRFQVAKRRRRQGKTDYHARRKMVRQDKNKFNNRKYRLVVRFTNKRCICQCVYATLRGDVVVAAAASNELLHFGIVAGHKNYAAAYATGLLLARRVLKKFGLDEKFKGKEELDGEDYHIEDEDNEQRPFKCILDVGIRRTCVGHRMWGALKGAVDGGLHIPHSTKNFPGFKAADEKGGESEYDAEAHKEKIFGNHAPVLGKAFPSRADLRGIGSGERVHGDAPGGRSNKV